MMKTQWTLPLAGLLIVTAALPLIALKQGSHKPASRQTAGAKWKPQVVRTEAQWRKQLTPAQFDILRKAGTERAFTGEYNHWTQQGTFVCAACGNILFATNTKFDSGTGWPSFWKAASKTSVHEQEDDSFGETRTEVLCARCGGHLGHVFTDGPQPTGLRYCMNSLALQFKPPAKKP